MSGGGSSAWRRFRGKRRRGSTWHSTGSSRLNPPDERDVRNVAAAGRLRVLADGSALGPEPSGASARFGGLWAAAARREGLHVAALLRPGCGPAAAVERAGGAILAAGPLPPPVLRSLRRLHPAARAADEGLFDVLAAETLPLPRPGSGTPVAATLHDLRFLRTAYAGWARRAWAALFLRRALERAAAVICVSASIAGELTAAGLCSADKVRVIPNAAPAPAALSATRGEEIRAGLGLGDPYFLCVARPEPRKNLELLLDAFDTVARGDARKVMLVVAGSKTGRSWPALRRRIAASPVLQERVVFPGPVAEDVKAALFQGALACLQPSRYEGFGIPVLEAMAAGVPVICSSIPAHREVAGGAALFFDPGDAAALAAALCRLAADAGLRRALSAQGPERAGCFSWERSAALLEECLREAARAG